MLGAFLHIRRPLQPTSVASTYAIRQTSLMQKDREFSEEEARDIGRRIGIDWTTSRFDVEQFRMGLEVELEHGRRDPATNVSDDDEITTGKIARAHLNEFPDYYTRLARMEAEAERYWDDRGRDWLRTFPAPHPADRDGCGPTARAEP